MHRVDHVDVGRGFVDEALAGTVDENAAGSDFSITSTARVIFTGDDRRRGPTTVVPGEDRARMLVIEKSLPGGILVNKRGERFVNEAMPYIDVVKEMYAKRHSRGPERSGLLVFDATFRKSIPAGPILQAVAATRLLPPKPLRRAT